MSNLGNNMNMQQSLRSRIMNCLAFITTGTCYFGKFCRFNHPNPEEVVADRQRGICQPTPTPCKFFLAGFCKYGASCRFSHTLTVVPNLRLHFNADGLPKRLGANTCAFYMRFGICGYGVACKYDHPEPVNQCPHQGYGLYAADDVEDYYPAESREYQAGYQEVTNGGNGNGSQYVQQPEPIYYLAAESREYQNECHGVTNGGNENQQETQARTAVVTKEPCVTLSDAGLPLRPGKRVCRNYESLGLCKYGRRCKFDHPPALSSNDEGKPVSGSETPSAQQ